MFIVFLHFSDNRSAAKHHLQEHNDWINQGINSNTFLMAGSLNNGQGGCLLINCQSVEALEQHLQNDPFVVHNVVKPLWHQVTPSKIHPALDFVNSQH